MPFKLVLKNNRGTHQNCGGKWNQVLVMLVVCRSCQPSSDLLLVLIHFHHIPLSHVDDVGNIMALLRPGHFL